MAASYVRFAVDNAALLDLMFTTSMANGPDLAVKAPEHSYEIVTAMVRHGQETGRLQPGDPERMLLIILATVQGIASLVTSRRISAEQTDALIADAIALFIR